MLTTLHPLEYDPNRQGASQGLNLVGVPVGVCVAVTDKPVSNWLPGSGLLAAFYDAHIRALTGSLRVRTGLKEAAWRFVKARLCMSLGWMD